MWLGGFFLLCVVLVLMSSCTDPKATSPNTAGNGSDAEKFLTDSEKRLLDLNIKAGRAESSGSRGVAPTSRSPS
jgi:hypothetical protein